MNSEHAVKPEVVSRSPLVSPHLAGLADELMMSCVPHQRALLRMLAVGHRHQLEMHSLVWGVACEAPSSHAFPLVQVAGKLQENEPWLSAIETTPNVLPGPVVLALRMAEKNGCLDELLVELESCHRQQEFMPPNQLNPGTSLLGVGMRAFAVVYVLSYLMLWIVPKLQKAVEEFGTELPSSMWLLMSISAVLVNWWFLPIFVPLLLLPFWLSNAIRYFRRLNPLTWRQPQPYAEVNRRLALASASDTGLPIADRIKMMLGNVSTNKDTRRLNKVLTKIEANKDQWQALTSANIISRREANALSASSSGETQSWLLRWSAGQRQNRKSSRSAFAFRLLVGAANLVVAVLCALTCIAVFSTLIQLMEACKFDGG